MSVSGPAIGIVGLANVGKSTLFNALLKKQAAASANYPFTTIEPNVGVVEVPDARLEKLAEVIAVESTGPAGLHPAPTSSLRIESRQYQNFSATAGARAGAPRPSPVLKYPPIVPAIVKFVDIAGLVKGAHKGEGLGNQFLAHIREVDVIVFVLRGFESEDIIRSGSIDPNEDLEVLKDELLLKDLETVEKKKEISKKQEDSKNLDLLEKVKNLVEQGKWLADELSGDELVKIKDLQLLSTKKNIIVVNSDESSIAEAKEDKEDLGKEAPIEEALRICAKLEEELAGLSEDEQRQYLKELGIEESGLEKLIKRAYETLDLSTFLTAGPKEVRAWTIKRGASATQAAGVIHSDFERGFIAADVVSYDEFIESGGWRKAREKGLVKTIGKSEVMPPDVVVEFKFSV